MLGAEVEFDIRTPVSDDGLIAQVSSALARGLPEVAPRAQHSRLLTIVGNGPTARQCALAGDTLAVNGAMRLFVERGHAPTFWAACDPQAIVADFLTDAPMSTTYLIASKCHPSVFDRLADRKVFVWHIDDFSTWDMVEDRDPVPSSVSITLTAFDLMARFGYRRFETWGWDGCYRDGRSHATAQPHGASDITVEIGSAAFRTSTSWALEAQDAVHKFAQNPRDLRVKGGGMIGAMLQHHAPAGVAYT